MNQHETKKAGGVLGMNKTTRLGSWTMAMILILLAVLVVINLLVGALPRSLTRFDTTADRRYTLSATSENFLKSIDRDVNLIVVSQGGTITATLENFLDRYTAANSRIRVKIVDPLADPTALDRYSEIVSTGRYIIVESDLRYYTVDTLEMETVYLEDLGMSIDLYTYEEIMEDDSLVSAYYQYYGVDMTNATQYFNGEQQITSAIEYVVCEDMPHLYVLSGAGGNELSATLSELMDSCLLPCESLALEVGDSIPESASCVIVQAPSYDLTTSTADALIEYLERGGSMILLTTPDQTDMPNLMRVAKTFGVYPTTGGVLHEGNANKYIGADTVLKPTVNANHELTYTAYSNNMAMVMPSAHGILSEETLPDGVSVTELFNATDAYTVTSDGSETDWGKVATGIFAENSETGARLLWFASADAFSDTSASTYGNGSFYYFAMGAGAMNDKYTSALTAIEAMETVESRLTVSEFSYRALGIVMSLVIPIGLLSCGIVVWVRRRKA